MIKKILLTGAFLCSFSLLAEKPKSKNFLIFLVDDLGWQDLSLSFADQKTPWNSLYRTPNLEKLPTRMRIRTARRHAFPYSQE